jgi:glutathione S-transferase
MNLAAGLIKHSRRMACAALMQKYRKSADLDRAYALWKTASAFFSMNFGPSMWLERGEHAIYQDCREQYRELLARFDTYQPTEMEAFLKRLRADRLTGDDVAHLKFLSRLVYDNFDLTKEMPAEQERYARMIEAEGEALLGRKRIRQAEKLKLRGPHPKEDE